MKHSFVLDLNIAWFAQTLEDERGEFTLLPLKLVIEIIEQCHRIVFCEAHFRDISRLADDLATAAARRGPDVFALLTSASAIPDKVPVVPTPPHLSGEDKIPEDDRHLVRLAVRERAHLVTADGRLREAVERTRILDRKAHTRVLNVSEALALIGSS